MGGDVRFLHNIICFSSKDGTRGSIDRYFLRTRFAAYLSQTPEKGFSWTTAFLMLLADHLGIEYVLKKVSPLETGCGGELLAVQNQPKGKYSPKTQSRRWFFFRFKMAAQKRLNNVGLVYLIFGVLKS
jgi:hypothetical protein